VIYRQRRRIDRADAGLGCVILPPLRSPPKRRLELGIGPCDERSADEERGELSDTF